MFLGTVVHSLDHSQLTRIVTDPLHLLAFDNQEYELMGSVVGLIRAAITDDLPFLPLTTQFKDVAHPFFRSVYNKARQINPW